MNKNKIIFQVTQQKYIFIKNVINHLLKIHFPKISIDTIQQHYITEVHKYQNNLKSLLRCLPKKSSDTLYTVEEILHMLQDQEIPNNQTTPNNLNSFSESKLKFYSENSELRKFVNLYYPKGN